MERCIDPYLPMMVAADGFDDRDMINLCLMDRYIIEYEPYNFKGKLSDFPLTLAYGKLVVSTPEHPDAVPTTGVLHIPPRSAAVVMEQ